MGLDDAHTIYHFPMSSVEQKSSRGSVGEAGIFYDADSTLSALNL